MIKRWKTYFGIVLIVSGIIFLIQSIWHIPIWAYLWPVVFIGLGIWLLVRPAGKPFWIWWGDDAALGEPWYVDGNLKDHGLFLGETTLDLSREDISDRGGNYRFNGFAGGITILAPDDVGVKVRANYFGGSINIFGEEVTGVMAPIEDQTPGFDQALRKAYVEVNYFAGETKVIRLHE